MNKQMLELMISFARKDGQIEKVEGSKNIRFKIFYNYAENKKCIVKVNTSISIDNKDAFKLVKEKVELELAKITMSELEKMDFKNGEVVKSNNCSYQILSDIDNTETFTEMRIKNTEFYVSKALDNLSEFDKMYYSLANYLTTYARGYKIESEYSSRSGYNVKQRELKEILDNIGIDKLITILSVNKIYTVVLERKVKDKNMKDGYRVVKKNITISLLENKKERAAA